MDPMSGLSLAVNIIQLLDVATRIVSAGYALSKSPDGFMDENREAVEIATDIELLVTSLTQYETDWIAEHGKASMNDNEKALQGLCASCRDVARELIKRLNSLRPHGRFRGISMIRTSLLIVWKKDEIEKYTARLQAYREEVNTRLLAGMREHLRAIDKTNDVRFTSLDRNTQKLAIAIIDQRDVFTEKLDIHVDLLENIRSHQEKTNTLLVALTQQKMSPSSFGTSPPSYMADQAAFSSLSLLDAAKDGNIQILRRLLASPTIDVNCMNAQGRTALHYARDAGIAEKLINSNANVNADDFEGCTPLMIAVQDRRLDVVRLLLTRRANKDIKDDDKRSTLDYAADCPVTMYMLKHGHGNKQLDPALLHMAWLGDLEGVKFFLNEGAKATARAKDGGTALHDACKNGDIEIVRLLLDHGADVEAENNHHWRPLLLANIGKRWDVITELLSRGANIGALTPVGRNLVSAACARQNWKFARFFADQGVDVTTQDRQGHTALHFAILYRAKTNFIKHLISRGAPLDIQDATGETPLLVACMQDDVERVDLLLSEGARSDIPSKEGWTPLSYAANKNLLEIAKTLLKHDTISLKLKKGSEVGNFSPLEEAVHLGHANMVRLLLDHHASLDARNEHRFTPLHLAVVENNAEPEIVDMLLSAGANIEAIDNNGTTPLGLASFDGNLDAVRRLLDAGANIESTAQYPRGPDEDNGFTPLMLSVLKGSGNLEVTRLLLSRGANINARSAVICATALLLSIENKASEIALLLMESGADVNLANAEGKTPLMAAAEYKLPKVVPKLLKLEARPGVRDSEGRTAWIWAKHSGADRVMALLLGPDAAETYSKVKAIADGRRSVSIDEGESFKLET